MFRSDGNETALQIAASEGNTRIVESLLDAGANPNLVPAQGGSPIAISALGGHSDIVRLLLDAGADPNLGSPMCTAALGGHVDILQLLEERGAEHDRALACAAGSTRGTPAVVHLLSHEQDVDLLEDGPARTPLMHALRCYVQAKEDHENCLESAHSLYRHGASVNAVDDDGLTVMDHVIDAADEEDASEQARAEEAIRVLLAWEALPSRGVVDWMVKRETMNLFEAAAPAVLACFHPSQALIATEVSSYYPGEEDSGTILGVIHMQGFLDSYGMIVKFEYDMSRAAIRVTPGAENTLMSANPSCGLRAWTSLSRVDDAAVRAREKLARDITVAASVAATAIAALDSNIGKCVAEVSVDEMIGSIDDDTARITINAAWKSVQRNNARDIAKDVAIDELMRVIERENPELGAVLKAAGFIHCLRS